MASSTMFMGSNGIVFLCMDDQTGNMSIGSSNISSSNKLYIAGDIVTQCNIIVEGNITSTGGITLCNSVYLANTEDPESAPSYSWKLDSNTGIFHASNDTIGFSTAGTEKARIDYLGRFGIGTSNPQYTLDVNGPVYATGYCNLLLDLINSSSASNAPTAKALSNVNYTAIYASNTANFGSNTAYWSSNTGIPWASNTAVSASNTAIFGSNAGVFGSNAGVFGSNAGAFGSNAGVFGSNTAYWSSNTGIPWASNTAVAASNTAIFGSNAGVFGSNAGVFGSNAGAFGSNAGVFGSNTSVSTSNRFYPMWTPSNNFIYNIGSNIGIGFSNPSENLAIQSNMSLSNFGKVVLWTSNSFLGIGISNPAYTLDVNGTVNATTLSQGGNTLDSLYASSNAGYLSSNITYWSSNTSIPWASNTAVYASNIGVYSSNSTVFSSNTAVYASNAAGSGTAVSFSSNAAVFASNTAVYSSNIGVYSSNSTVFSSNTAVYASNAAGSGTAVSFSSNAAVFASNTSVYASNTGVYSSNSTVFSSNTAVYASNAAGSGTAVSFSSNAAVYASNTAVYASNSAIYASNTGNYASNSAIYASNTGNYASNTAIYASNTGIYASNLAVTISNELYPDVNATMAWTSSNSFVYILNSNIGIGISNPSYPLDVNGSVLVRSNLYVDQGIINSNFLSNLGSIYIASNTDAFGNITLYNSIFTLSNFGTNFIATSNNFIGIGTSNPQYNLDVNGITQTGKLIVTSNGESKIILWSSNTGQIPGIEFNRNTITFGADINNDFRILNSAGTLIFEGSNSTNMNAIAIGLKVLGSNLNVGIGFSNPAFPLDVNGSLYVRSNIYLLGTSNPGNTAASNIALYYNSNRQLLCAATNSNNIQTYQAFAWSNQQNINSNSLYYIDISSRTALPLFTSYCNITFDTHDYLIPQYFTHVTGTSNIKVNENGTYMFAFTANINIFNASNTSASLTFKAQLNGTDILPTATMIASETYSSKNLRFILNANSNDVITFQGKLNGGNSNVITASNGGVSVTAIKFNYQSSNIFKSINTSVVQLGTGYSNILLDSNVINNNIDVYTASNNGFQINSNGTYLLLSKVAFGSSNSVPTNIHTRLLKNGTELNGSYCYTYTLDSNVYGINSCSTSYVLSCASNDIITIESRLVNTSATNAVFTSVNNCELSAIQLSNTNIIQCYYSNAGTSNFSQSFVNVPFNTITFSNSSLYALSNSYIINANNGQHLAFYSLSYSNFNPSNITSDIVSRINLNSNIRKNVFGFANSNGINTACSETTLAIPRSNLTSLECANMKFTSNMSFMHNACRLMMIQLDNPTASLYNNFGNSYFTSGVQPTMFMTNSSNYVTVREMYTPYINNGSYRIGMYCDYVARCPQAKYFGLRLTINGNSIYTRNINTYNNYNLSNNETWFINYDLSNAIYNIHLEAITYNSNDYLYVYNSVLDLWQTT